MHTTNRTMSVTSAYVKASKEVKRILENSSWCCKEHEKTVAETFLLIKTSKDVFLKKWDFGNGHMGEDEFCKSIETLTDVLETIIKTAESMAWNDIMDTVNTREVGLA